jgi:pimeloyl-ACP methyl ester carboxylesterase
MNIAAIGNLVKNGAVYEVLHDMTDPESHCHLVLIHGIADSPDVWREAVKNLGIRFKSYLEMCLPWNSAIGDPITYEPSPENLLRNTWRELPKGPKVIFAHSFGANCFLKMGQSEPLDDVKAIVLLSIYTKESFADFSWSEFIRYVNEFDKFLLFSIESRPASKNMSTSTKELIKDKTKEFYSPPSWIKFYQLFSTTPGLDLSYFTMPVLVLGGENDFSIEFRDIKSFAERLPESEFYYFKHCGHFAMLEDPIQTAEKIHNFLNTRKISC